MAEPANGAAPRAPFTREGVRRGSRTALPLLIGYLPFALVIGVISQGRGLSLLETGLMGATVFAGASQLLALELWADPVPVVATMVAALVVNLRFLPITASLSHWFVRLRGWRVWGTLATVTDHALAFSVTEERAGRVDAGFLLGLGLVTWVGWIVFCVAGHMLGSAVVLPPGHALYFASVSAFISLLVPLWRGFGRDLLPWLLAAFLSLGLFLLGAPTPVPLLSGALGGASLAAWLATRRRTGS